MIRVTKKRLLIVAGIFLALVLAAQIYDIAHRAQAASAEPANMRPITIWYGNPDIQSYMEDAAHTLSVKLGTEVTATMVLEVDYIENICEQSVAEEMKGPDLYVASSALLEKARLAGLTTAVDEEGVEDEYSEHALQAMTCQGELVARPFYLETSFFLYNNYYVDPERNGVPETIDAILAWAENYEADEVTGLVENIFQWNVADVMEDYLFLGGYTDLGGTYGDDKSQVSIDLEKAAKCMEYYQNLNAFFAIDADTITSDAVIQNFIDGKTVFTIANVPMLTKVNEAVINGEIPEYVTSRTVKTEDGTEEVQELNYDSFYGIAGIPNLTEELETKGLSVTTGVVVNPYSPQRESAESCARYLTEDAAGTLYETSGVYPASKSAIQALPARLQNIAPIYEEAQETPKIMELSNIWLQMEATLSDIWRGEDVQEELEAFSDLLQRQLQ